MNTNDWWDFPDPVPVCLTHFDSRYADAIVLFANDDVLDRLSTHANHGTLSPDHKLTLKQKTDAVSFTDMNKHIASCMTGVFLPVDTLTPKR